MIEIPYQVNDRFELVELLGTGSFSDVYLARDHEPGTGPALVALKLFKSLKGRNRDSQRSLSAFEFQMLSRLRHPNLATVYDYGTDPASGRVWFTMERIGGVDFLEAVGEMQPLETLPLVVDTCRALHHIHTRGLIHHDLKPGNLIVTRTSADGSPLDRPLVKLTDFGLSTTFDQADDGHLRGTPEFMAPEMLAGRDKDHRCDLYALGVLLYLSISGRYPFPEGRRPGTERETPPPLQNRNDEPAPAFLEDLVSRLLKANPGDRYQTANDVIRDLGLHTGTVFALEPGTVGASSAAADTVLTITRDQLEKLHRRMKHLGRGETGQCRPALVVGGPGAGKSHLVLELRRLAQTSGAGFLFHSPDGRTVTDAPDPVHQADELFRQARRIRRHQESGVVVVLDLEELGLAAVSAILDHWATLPPDESTFVLTTAAPGNPEVRLLLERETADKQALELFRLRPLDLKLMAGFLSLQLGNPLDADHGLTACVLAESDGVPLLAEEVLAHLQASGALTLPPSGPCFDPDLHQMDFTVPAGHLRQHHRPTARSAATEALTALAVFGAPATARLVSDLMGTGQDGEPEVADILTSTRNQLLNSTSVDGVELFRFRSLLARNLVRNSLDEKCRRDYHRRAAGTLLRGTPSPGTDPSSLIWQHLMLAGETEAAWREGLDHGHRLEETHRFAEALRIYELLIGGGAVDRVSPGLATRLILRSANLLRAAGKADDAAKRLKEAQALATAHRHPEQLARIKLQTGYLLERQGDHDGARTLFQEGLDTFPVTDSSVYGDLMVSLGLNALWSGQPEEADRLLATCRETFGASKHPDSTESCLFLEASILRSRQQPDAAVYLLQNWLAGDGSAGDSLMSGRLKVMLGDVCYHQNRFDDASRLFGEGMEIFKRRGEQSLEAITLSNLGALHFEQGRFSTAGRYNLDCLRAHERIGDRFGQSHSQYNLGVCDFHQGRYAEAMKHLQTARGIREYINDSQGLAQCLNMEAELCLTVGDTEGAAGHLQASATALGPKREGYSAGDQLLLEAELLFRTSSPEAAEAVCRRAEEMFTRLGDNRQRVRTTLLTARCLAARGRSAETEEALTLARNLADELNVPRLDAERLLTESALRIRHGIGPTHESCSDRCKQLLDQLADVEDPDFLQSLHASLGCHLETMGNENESMAAYHRAFQMLRQVAGRFGPRQAKWKSTYLSTEQRSAVIRRVADWSRKKSAPNSQAMTD